MHIPSDTCGQFVVPSKRWFDHADGDGIVEHMFVGCRGSELGGDQDLDNIRKRNGDCECRRQHQYDRAERHTNGGRPTVLDLGSRVHWLRLQLVWYWDSVLGCGYGQHHGQYAGRLPVECNK